MTQATGAYHWPVMVSEVLESLGVHPGGTYIDCTLGDGGHAVAILEAAGAGPATAGSEKAGRVLGIDADPEAVVATAPRLAEYGQSVTIVNTNPLEPRDVILQAGSFGEHLFTEATTDAHISEEAPMQVNSKHLAVRLGPAATAQLSLGLKRFAGVPSYAQPCT